MRRAHGAWILSAAIGLAVVGGGCGQADTVAFRIENNPDQTAGTGGLTIGGTVQRSTASGGVERLGGLQGAGAPDLGALVGYALVSPEFSSQVSLVDAAGSVLHRWELELALAAPPHLLDDGSLLCAGYLEARMGRGEDDIARVQRWSWEGELLGDHPAGDEERSVNRMLARLPDGKLLLYEGERERALELAGAGLPVREYPLPLARRAGSQTAFEATRLAHTHPALWRLLE